MLEFVIEAVVSYAFDQAPLEEIYGGDGQARITLITCSGNWQQDTEDYDRRLVVSAVLSEFISTNPARTDQEP